MQVEQRIGELEVAGQQAPCFHSVQRCEDRSVPKPSIVPHHVRGKVSSRIILLLSTILSVLRLTLPRRLLLTPFSEEPRPLLNILGTGGNDVTAAVCQLPSPSFYP